MGYDSAAAAGTVRMFLTGVCVLAAAQIARVFYEGIQTRRKFQQMKAQGIVSWNIPPLSPVDPREYTEAMHRTERRHRADPDCR